MEYSVLNLRLLVCMASFSTYVSPHPHPLLEFFLDAVHCLSIKKCLWFMSVLCLHALSCSFFNQNLYGDSYVFGWFFSLLWFMSLCVMLYSEFKYITKHFQLFECFVSVHVFVWWLYKMINAQTERFVGSSFKKIFFLNLKSFHIYMVLDWSYNYHANNMYQQVATVEIYVKKITTKITSVQSTNIHIHLCLYPYSLV